MNNGRITQKQGIYLIALFIIGDSSIMVMGFEAKRDIWISILCAGVACMLLMLIYSRLMSVLPDKGFFETLEFFIGKIGTKIILVVFTWYFFDSCYLILRNYGQFVVTVGLRETPLIIPMIMMLTICVIGVRLGIEVLGRWIRPFVFCVIAFILINVLLVSQNMQISNLLPVIDHGIGPIAKGTLGVITFPFAEVIVFLFAFPAFKQGNSVKKVFLYGLAIGGVIIFITSLTDILVLGHNIAENRFYPTFSTMATIQYGDFISRMEVITAIIFIVTVFVKISIYLLAICKGTTRLLGLKDYKFIVIPIAFLLVNFGSSFDSTIYYHEWVFKVWPYYAPLFQIIIPILLLILIEIKRKGIMKKVGVKS